MSVTELPPATDLRRLLELLTGRDVTARSELTALIGSAELAAVGTYVDEGAVVRAVAAFDLAGAASVAAALSLLPRGRVAESVKAGRLDPDLGPNLSEVLNVGASLFNGEGRPHLVFRHLHLAPDVPAELALLLDRPTGRLDCRVDVDGYGSGVLVLLTAGGR